jgi:hypothetical protein
VSTSKEEKIKQQNTYKLQKQSNLYNNDNNNNNNNNNNILNNWQLEWSQFQASKRGKMYSRV